MVTAVSRQERMPGAIYALSIGAFGIGTTEFVVMGLLLEMAHDFGVSIGSAGYIVTAYALGVVLGAPLLTPILNRYPRRLALTGLMAIFTIGNLACAAATYFPFLLVARIVTALAHASYFGIGSVVASEIAPSSRKSSAIAAMFLGATIANVLGVPVGTFIGQHFGWRYSFAAVAVLGALATLVTYIFLPSEDKAAKRASTNFRKELTALKQPAVLRALAITTLGFSGTFAVFTYIAPMLTMLAGVPERYVSPVLFLFGGGMIVGNVIGARLADKDSLFALRATLAFLAIVLLSFRFGMMLPATACMLVFLLGAAMFATISPLQTYVIQVAKDAPTMAASCNIAAFNLGNALGAWAGGEIIDSGFGLHAVPIVATFLTGIGLTIALAGGRRLRLRQH